jgi:hypothetical protein
LLPASAIIQLSKESIQSIIPFSNFTFEFSKQGGSSFWSLVKGNFVVVFAMHGGVCFALRDSRFFNTP